MRTLERYLVLRFLGFFVATLVVLSLAVLMAEMLLNLEELREAAGGIAGAFLYLGLQLPGKYLFALIPISAFIAAFAALGTLARSSELTASKAIGMSPVVLCLPLLIAGLGISLATLATTETLGVRAADTWHRLYRGQVDISYRRGSFWYHSGSLVYNVRHVDPETRTLRDILVFQLDERGRLLQSIQAREASIEDETHWRMREVLTRRFDPDDPVAPPDFERAEERLLKVERKEDLALLNANPSGLPLPDLQEYVSREEFQGGSVTRLRAHLHQRVADPFVALVFTLLAIPVGIRVEQTRSLALPAIVGVAVVALFWVARSFGVTLASGGAAPAAVVPWAVLGIFTLAGSIALWRSPR